MYKLSEASRITGVNRRKLQEYNRIGLLQPTMIAENNYWYYDDKAIEKLMTIQIFSEAGYTRKDIQRLFKLPAFDIKAELDQTVSKLEEKRKRIDGMIKTVKAYKHGISFAEKELIDLQTQDAIRLFRSKGFKTYMDETIEALSDSDFDDATVEMSAKLGLCLYKIGLLSEKEIDDPEVKKNIDSFVEAFCDVLETLVDDPDELYDMTDEEVQELFCGYLDNVTSDSSFTEIMHACGKKNAASFIKKAVKHYYKALIPDNINKMED